MKISDIFTNPTHFEIQKLTGGYLGGAEKVSALVTGEQYILKRMGQTDEQVAHALTLLAHIQGFGKVLTNMAHVCDWEVQEEGTLLTLFEFIEHTEARLPNITEMLQISQLSFLASRQYDHTLISPTIDIEKCTLAEISHNGIDRYTEKYFLPYTTAETRATLDWMWRWADYFIKDTAFQEQYLESVGFIHRDIHRHNIVINNGEPYLIDFDFSGVDCRLIEITRPTNVYIAVDEFLPMCRRAKQLNAHYFSKTETEILDRILVLDMLANLGWEAYEIHKSDAGTYRDEIINFLQNRLAYLHQLMINRQEFNLDFV